MCFHSHYLTAPAVNPSINCLDRRKNTTTIGMIDSDKPANKELQSVEYSPKNLDIPTGIV